MTDELRSAVRRNLSLLVDMEGELRELSYLAMKEDPGGHNPLNDLHNMAQTWEIDARERWFKLRSLLPLSEE